MGSLLLTLAGHGIRTGILTLAMSLQLLPIFFMLVVFAFFLGFTDLGMLLMFPVFLLAIFAAACWLTARQVRRRPRPAPHRPTAPEPKPGRPVRDGVVLIKTREERYRDLVEVFKIKG